MLPCFAALLCCLCFAFSACDVVCNRGEHRSYDFPYIGGEKKREIDCAAKAIQTPASLAFNSAGSDGAWSYPTSNSAGSDGAWSYPTSNRAGSDGAWSYPTSTRAGSDGAWSYPTPNRAGSDGAWFRYPPTQMNNKKRRANSLLEDAKKAGRDMQNTLAEIINLLHQKPTENPKEAYIRVYWYLTTAIMTNEPDLPGPWHEDIDASTAWVA